MCRVTSALSSLSLSIAGAALVRGLLHRSEGVDLLTERLEHPDRGEVAVD